MPKKIYANCAQDAIDKILAGEGDEILAAHGSFSVLHYDDRVLGDSIRALTLKTLKSTSIRYIITKGTADSRVCYTGSGITFSSVFKNAYIYINPVEGENKARSLRERGIPCQLEEYLFKANDICRDLRIYYDSQRGFRRDQKLLAYIKKQVNNRVLTSRRDNKNKRYVILTDLLKLKNISVPDSSCKINLRYLLHDGLISFNEITAFVQRHNFEPIAPVMKLSRSKGVSDRRVFYDIGLICEAPEVKKALIEDFGYSEWF